MLGPSKRVDFPSFSKGEQCHGKREVEIRASRERRTMPWRPEHRKQGNRVPASRRVFIFQASSASRSRTTRRRRSPADRLSHEFHRRRNIPKIGFEGKRGRLTRVGSTSNQINLAGNGRRLTRETPRSWKGMESEERIWRKRTLPQPFGKISGAQILASGITFPATRKPDLQLKHCQLQQLIKDSKRYRLESTN